jgi:AhpD family alkylhydroperoxidase
MQTSSSDDMGLPLEDEPRIRYGKAAPQALKVMRDMQDYVDRLPFPRNLLELVKIRASRINGCDYCLDMHSKDARALGQSEERIRVLDGWRESNCYSDVEKAALEWTEAVTLVSDTHVPREVYDRVRQHFEEKELVELTLAIIAINAWNRLSIAFRYPKPGSYVSHVSNNRDKQVTAVA